MTDWSTVAIDTPVMVKKVNIGWRTAHYSGLDLMNNPTFWASGTSWEGGKIRRLIIDRCGEEMRLATDAERETVRMKAIEDDQALERMQRGEINE